MTRTQEARRIENDIETKMAEFLFCMTTNRSFSAAEVQE